MPVSFSSLLPVLVLLSFVQLTLPALAAATPTTCAADYASCGGGVPSPLSNMPCCSENFFCYTQGPYFSQCRPRKERMRTPAVTFTAPFSRWYRVHSRAAAFRSFLTAVQASRYGATPILAAEKIREIKPTTSELRATLPRLSRSERFQLLNHVSAWSGVCATHVQSGVLSISVCPNTLVDLIARQLSELHVVASVYAL